MFILFIINYQLFMLCHILIGCPSSGKSTLAETIVKNHPHYTIISTDRIRQQLFGDETIQGNWSEIETEVFQQIEASLHHNQPLIYDATNAKRPWRFALLNHLNRYQNIDWLGWYLQTPLSTCLQWNQHRERNVPEAVIRRMSQHLKQFPPIAAEGFATVYTLNPNSKVPLIDQFNQKTAIFSRSLINRQNRTQNIILHNYSNLLDFERLMYLIHLLLTYPRIGNLQETHPETLINVLGKNSQEFVTEVDEICAFMAQIADPIYADSEAIKQDLQWLEENGVIGATDTKSDLNITIQEVSEVPNHSYSDLETFQRLIQTIRLIIHEPFIWKKELKGTLNSLVDRMRQDNLVDYDCRDTVRKDIEKVLKPYGILPDFPMKRGYFAGTAILSQEDLIQVFELLKTQSKDLDDPVALNVYETFKHRMETAKLIESQGDSIRAIYHHQITNLEMISDLSLVQDMKMVKEAITQGKLLELGKISPDGFIDNFFKAYPLQIIFHHLHWYLGFELDHGKAKGLLQFERLDRLCLGEAQKKQRSQNTQQKSLHRLLKLYHASGDLFLGNDPKLQEQYLSENVSEREKIEVAIEIWLNEATFRFMSEGIQRFPKEQMKLSLPFNRELLRKNRLMFSLRKTSDPQHPHRCRIRLPQWSLEDPDFHSWLLGFGGQVKVVSPDRLREILSQKGNQS